MAAVALVGQLVTTSLISLVSLWILTLGALGSGSAGRLLSNSCAMRATALTGITNFANANADLIFITWYTGAAGAGLYSLAKRLVNAVSTVIGNALNRVFFSTIAGLQHDRKRHVRRWSTSCMYTSLLTAPLSPAWRGSRRRISSLAASSAPPRGEAAPLLAIMSITGFLTTIGLYNQLGDLGIRKAAQADVADTDLRGFEHSYPSSSPRRSGLIAIAVGYVGRALLLYPLSAGPSMRILSRSVSGPMPRR